MDHYFIEILIIYTTVMTTKQGKTFFLFLVIPVCLETSNLIVNVNLNEHKLLRSYLIQEERNHKNGFSLYIMNV